MKMCAESERLIDWRKSNFSTSTLEALSYVRVDLDVPRWSEQECAEPISTLTRELSKGGILIGAIDCNQLVGATVLGHRFIGENLDEIQLVFLHVSNGYRRRGTRSCINLNHKTSTWLKNCKTARPIHLINS